jgi:hypothetical protein
MTRIPHFGTVLHRAILALLAAFALSGCGSKEPEGDAAAGTDEAAPATTAGKDEAASTSIPAPRASLRESPKDAVDQVMARFLDARSYHVTMDTRAGERAMKVEMDFVAPDRYRMTTPAGTQHVIGDTMYMTMQGRTMKMPMSPGQMSQFRDSSSFAEHRETMTVESMGSEAVDGKAARKYFMRNTQPQPVETTLWIGDDGYPVQVAVSGQAGGQSTQTMIRYSRFNDPTIRIDPPQ